MLWYIDNLGSSYDKEKGEVFDGRDIFLILKEKSIYGIDIFSLLLLIVIKSIAKDKLNKKFMNKQAPSERFSQGLDHNNLNEYCSAIERICEELSTSTHELTWWTF